MKNTVYKNGGHESVAGFATVVSPNQQDKTMKPDVIEAKAVDTNPAGEFSLREKYLTKRQVAALLQVTPRSIDNFMKRGQLVFTKIGRTVRFRLADIEQHLNATARVCRRTLAK